MPGTRFRFGLDPILGLVPGLGDLVGGSFSAYLIWIGFRLGAPASVLVRMAMNVGVDALFGAIPLLGDVADAGYKANIRNMKLLESYAVNPEDVSGRSKVLLFAILGLLLVVLIGSIWLAITILGMLLDPLF